MENKTPYKVRAAGNITSGLLLAIFSAISLCMYIDALTGYGKIDDFLDKLIFVEWVCIAIGAFCFFYGCYLVSKATTECRNEKEYNRYWTRERYNKRATVLVVCGVIMLLLILLMYSIEEELNDYLPDDLFFPTYISPMVIVCAYCFIEAIIFIGFASNEPSANDIPIEYNSEFWAKNSSQRESHNGETQIHNSVNKSLPPTTFWQCSKCGKINASYVGTCGCGGRQGELKSADKILVDSQQLQKISADESTATHKSVEQQPDTSNKDNKYCPYCGKAVKENHVFCRECGAKLD